MLQSTVERLYVNDAYCDIQRGVFIVRGENVLLLGEIVCAATSPPPSPPPSSWCSRLVLLIIHSLGLPCHTRIWTARTTSRFDRLQWRRSLQGSDTQTRKRNIRIRSIGRSCVHLGSRMRGKCLSEEEQKQRAEIKRMHWMEYIGLI